MATIAANALGVYTFEPPPEGGFFVTDYDKTTPFGIAHKTASTEWESLDEFPSYGEEGIDGWWTNLEWDDYSSDKFYLLLNTDGSFADVVYPASQSQGFTFANASVLMSLATSTTIEATNTVNETVARNGADGSTTFIVGGAMSWSMSVDGLLDLSSTGVGTSTGVMDAARSKEYVILKFDTGSDVNYVGQALIDSVSISGGVDDIATYSASFNGYGDLYKYTES